MIKKFAERCSKTFKQFFTIALITLSIGGATTIISINVLYNAALTSEQKFMVELIKGYSALIDSVAAFDAKYSTEDHPHGSQGATLSQIQNSFQAISTLKTNEELIIGKYHNEEFIVLLSSNSPNKNFQGKEEVAPRIHQLSKLSMQYSGILTIKDHKQEEYIAVYEYKSNLDIYLLTRINVNKLRQPFVEAAIQSSLLSLFIILLGLLFIEQVEMTVGRSRLFGKISSPYVAIQRWEKIFYRIILLTITCVMVISSSIWSLYSSSYNNTASRLLNIATSHANFIEAVAKFDEKHNENDFPGGAKQATWSQLTDALSKRRHFGKSGEYLLGIYDGQFITFQNSFLTTSLSSSSVHLSSSNSQAMKNALLGITGLITSIDYKGNQVLAAHAPLKTLGAGLVVKMDLKEIRYPFVYSAIISSISAAAMIMLSIAFFYFREESAEKKFESNNLPGILNITHENTKSPFNFKLYILVLEIGRASCRERVCMFV